MRWDIFCRVIDNYGDVGVCWRLAADLAGARRAGAPVDRRRRARWPGWRRAARRGVEVVGLDDGARRSSRADVVVEAFGCDPPAGASSSRMAAATARAGLDQPRVPERRGLCRALARPALAAVARAGRRADEVVLLSRLHAAHRRPAARARPAASARTRSTATPGCARSGIAPRAGERARRACSATRNAAGRRAARCARGERRPCCLLDARRRPRSRRRRLGPALRAARCARVRCRC